jgi:type II secretory pathway pseudopilin PulG
MDLPHISGNPGSLRTRAYTLFEILLALGIVAVILGITIPYVAESFGRSPGDEAQDALARAVQDVRTSAMEKGEARKIGVSESGFVPEIDSVAEVRIPADWKLSIRKMSDSKFRKPGKNEKWTVNGAGICEPATFLLRGPHDEIEILFDPLTGLVVHE